MFGQSVHFDKCNGKDTDAITNATFGPVMIHTTVHIDDGAFGECQAALLFVGTHSKVVQCFALWNGEADNNLDMIGWKNTFFAVYLADEPIHVDTFAQQNVVAFFEVNVTKWWKINKNEQK